MTRAADDAAREVGGGRTYGPTPGEPVTDRQILELQGRRSALQLKLLGATGYTTAEQNSRTLRHLARVQAQIDRRITDIQAQRRAYYERGEK